MDSFDHNTYSDLDNDLFKDIYKYLKDILIKIFF
jgi:hypothetical protein